MRRCLCGAMPTVVKINPYDGDYTVRCKKCGIKCPSAGRDEKEAEEAWNRFIDYIIRSQ